MQMNKCIACESFPCIDVNHDRYIVPNIDIDPDDVSIVMISEATPDNPADYYYAGDSPLFEQNTLQAFKLAGIAVDSLQDLLNLGFYFTTAVKCGKTGYGIKAATIKECSLLLEQELTQFHNLKIFMLMGDVAIKAINYIAKRSGEPRAIPAGSTYKIRGGEFHFQSKRAFPSYLQVGPSFGIEKSKQRMIAEDIAAAMKLLS